MVRGGLEIFHLIIGTSEGKWEKRNVRNAKPRSARAMYLSVALTASKRQE